MHEPNFFAIQDSTMCITRSAHLRFPRNGNKNVGCLYKTVEEIPKQNFLFKNMEITQCIVKENSDFKRSFFTVTKGGGGHRAATRQSPLPTKKIVGMTVSKVLRDISISRNKPLK